MAPGGSKEKHWTQAILSLVLLERPLQTTSNYLAVVGVLGETGCNLQLKLPSPVCRAVVKTHSDLGTQVCEKQSSRTGTCAVHQVTRLRSCLLPLPTSMELQFTSSFMPMFAAGPSFRPWRAKSAQRCRGLGPRAYRGLKGLGV